MNWTGVGFVVVLVIIVAVLVRKRKSKDLGGRTLIIHGFTKIGYNINDMDAVSAERLAGRLRVVCEKAWAGLYGVYGEKATFGIEHIIFDPKFEEKDDRGGRVILRKVIRMLVPEAMITLRPQGGAGHTAEFWIAGEMHNLYRFLIYGMDGMDLPENPSDAEMKLWRAGKNACKEALP